LKGLQLILKPLFTLKNIVNIWILTLYSISLFLIILKREKMKLKFTITIILCTFFSYAQDKITGKITDEKDVPLIGVNIRLLNNNALASSGFTGDFTIRYNGTYPANLQITYADYISQTYLINDASGIKDIIIKLKEDVNTLNQVVVSASRTEEKKLESPVNIETLSAKQIKNGTSADFYNGIENLKEVQLNSGSFLHKSINTRGFATAENPRFMQLIDGMENSSPSLNVSIGNLLGMNELDVAGIEILPGASSALYGANAFNGIMFMNSASPFTKRGISGYFKQGFTSQDVGGNNTFNDLGVRVADAFSDKFAVKLNLTYFNGTDWLANDERNVAAIAQTLLREQFYDGVNIYGDEIIRPLARTGIVSRTGYKERDLNNGGKVENFKADASIHFRPKASDFEIILQQKLGIGSTNYTASDARTYLKDFMLFQTKLELKGRNFFIRSYFTGQDAGKSYSMTRAAFNINEKAKSNDVWFNDFITAYNTISPPPPLAPTDYPGAIKAARAFADRNETSGLPLAPSVGEARFEPGSAKFNQAFIESTSSTDSKTGSRFKDDTRFFHQDLNYNFRDLVKFAEIQVGGSLRNYILDSDGSLFTDKDENITLSEFGLYSQMQKKLINDRLKLTGSFRYDKAKNFNGNISPRISLSYAFGKEKQRNLRASFQTGFRNPTNQDQYSGNNIGLITLLGSAKDNLERYNEQVVLSAAGKAITGQDTFNLNGNVVYNDSFTLASTQEYSTIIATQGLASVPLATSKLKKLKVEIVQPEKVKSYEIGYRASILNFSFDLNAYLNDYSNFIYTKKVVTPFYVNGPTGIGGALLSNDFRAHQVYTNATVPVQSRGIGFGLTREIGNFDIAFSYNHAELKYDKTIDPDFLPGFNTPKNRTKLTLGNDKLFKNFGVNTNIRWSSEYEWQSSFATGIIPEIVVFDAQFNYSIPKANTNIKVGANNLFGQDYLQVIGAGLIGKQYFFALTYTP
jgi:outer membrane receptor protein involved in Fe transport